MEEQNSILPQDLNQENNPEEEKSTTLPLEEPKVKKKKSFLIIALVFLFLIVSGLLTYYLLTRDTGEVQKDEGADSKVSFDLEQELKIEEKEFESKGEIKGKVFYVAFVAEDGTNNIFSYDLNDGTIKKLTNETSVTMKNEKISSVYVVDSKTIAFQKNPGEIYTIDSSTGEEEKLYQTEYIPMDMIGFYSKDKFAFIKGLDRERQELILYENGVERILGAAKILGGERGAGYYDNMEISFSPKGNNIFINTVEDRNTPTITQIMTHLTVYDLNLNLAINIQRATHPEWVNNDNFIYVSLDFVEQQGELYQPIDAPKQFLAKGIGIYQNAVGQTTETITVFEDDEIAHPRLLNNKLAYVKNFKEIWVYETSTETKHKVTDISEGIITKVFWINSENIIYSVRVGGDGGIDSYGAIEILNLETNEVKEIMRGGLQYFVF